MSSYNFNGIGNEPNADKRSSNMIAALPLGGLQNAKPGIFTLVERIVATELRTVKGSDNVRVITRIGGKPIVVSGLLTAVDELTTSSAAGTLPNRSITPETVLFTHAGAANNIEDDGEGILQDAGGGAARGTINYDTGAYSYVASGVIGVTSVAYNHTDYVSVSGGAQTENSTNGAASSAFADSTAFPIVPGTLALTDQAALVFEDDGKGNVIQTNAGNVSVGTVNYGTGAISLSGITGTITTSMDIAYNRDFYSKTVAAGGGHLTMQYLPDGGEFWADAVKSTPIAQDGGAYTPSVLVGIFAEAAAANGNNALRVNFVMRGEDTFENPDLGKRSDVLEDSAGTGVSY